MAATPEAYLEKKRSVPKKSVKQEPVRQTVRTSFLPYAPASMKSEWGDASATYNAFASGLVLKFGGSSCGNKLGQVMKVIEESGREGPVAVVVSAMGRTTDHLIDAADKACIGDLDGANEKVALIREIVFTNIREHAPGDASEGIEAKINLLLTELTQLLLGISLVLELSPATLDRLLSFGERLSATTLACLLNANNVPAFMVDGKDWVVTDDEFGKARVEWRETLDKLNSLVSTWPADSIPVVTGFLGATKDGRRTTLGRNGSDFTATLLGCGLRVRNVVINTDVPGVYTADPNIVKEAYPVPELTYVEAMELSIYGSRMFHPRTILPLVEQRIPMIIRNTDDPNGKATIITDNARPQTPTLRGGLWKSCAATCVTQLENLAVLNLRSRLGQPDDTAQVQHIGLRLTSCLGRVGIKIHHASFAANGQTVYVVIGCAVVNEAREAMLLEFEREIRRHELDEMNVWQPVTLLSLVRAPQPVLPKFFAALTAARVRLRAIGQGSNTESVSCVIDAQDTAVAVRCAHTAINLGHQVVSLLIIGNNASSQGLIQRIHSQRAEIRSRYNMELRVVGIFHTCSLHKAHNRMHMSDETVHLHENGMNCEDTVRDMLQCKCNDRSEPASKRISHVVPIRVLQRLRQMSFPMIVDCNRLELEVEDFYRSCYQMGLHVVVSNAASIVRLQAAEVGDKLGREPALTYDTCVGASVPISDTLRMLNQMGDRVVSMTGSLSGTCGFIIDQLMLGVSLSKAVAEAKARRFTEPSIATDLGGIDIARKLIVLARQMGQHLSVEDMRIEPFLPCDDLGKLDPDETEDHTVLEKYDEAMAARVEEAKGKGCRLAYLASIDFTSNSATIAPAMVDSSHPAFGLKNTDIYVSLYRESTDSPLLLQGPGCGSSSALGLTGDILKTAQRLQGAVL